MPTKRERRLLKLLADNGGAMNHEEKALDPFSDDNGRKVDTFNRCSAEGWIRSTHNSDTDESIAYLTEAGRAALAASTT